jgi:hypothetical protein
MLEAIRGPILKMNSSRLFMAVTSRMWRCKNVPFFEGRMLYLFMSLYYRTFVKVEKGYEHRKAFSFL